MCVRVYVCSAVINFMYSFLFTRFAGGEENRREYVHAMPKNLVVVAVGIALQLSGSNTDVCVVVLSTSLVRVFETVLKA